MQKLLLFSLKALVTGGLIYWSFKAVSFAELRDQFEDINLLWMVPAFFMILAQNVLQGLRWCHIVRASGFPLRHSSAIRLNFIAAFFNQTLPSTIGGDAARIWMLARGERAGWRIASYSVFDDRIVGVMALAFLVAICLPWTFMIVNDPIARFAVSAIAVGGVTGGVLFLSLSFAKGSKFERLWGIHHLVAASTDLRRAFHPYSAAAFLVVVSLLIHIFSVAVAWVAARSIDAVVDFIQLMCLVPPIILISIAPISVAGWGLRESLMVMAFTLAGLQAGDALVISLLLGATSFVVGLIGGAIWIANRLSGRTQLDPEP